VTAPRERRRFRNAEAHGANSIREVVRWQRRRHPAPWPEWVEDPAHPPPPRLASGLAVTYIGHASFYVQIAGRGVLLDPIWSARCSPLSFIGPKRVRAPGQKLGALPGVDLLLVSHNHYDHMDLPTLRRVRRRWNPLCFTGLENARHLRKVGIIAHELDWWQHVETAGLTITYVPAQHFSARGLTDRNRSLWGGFVIQGGGHTLYYAADSGWCRHFAEIGQRFPGIDLALLPIGAYEPRWFMHIQHMNPEEAVRAHLALGARRSIGMHFGTFAGLTDEGFDAPLRALAAARERHGVAEQDFTTLPCGATLILG
jgi:L-ascorbate metabolism protein UlaG (beta-lactamase superfamily)